MASASIVRGVSHARVSFEPQEVRRLVYVEGEHLLGDDSEATVDSSHPNDLGMMCMADALGPVPRPLVGKQ
jgi:hypothetical protein